MDESNNQNDFVELCNINSDQSLQNPTNEPVFTLEADNGRTIRITQSEYLQLIAPLQSALEEQMNEQAAEYGHPLVEDPVYRKIKELCQNPNNCTQANIDSIVFDGNQKPSLETSGMTGAYIGVDDISQQGLPLSQLRGIGCSDKSRTAFLVKGSVQNTVAVISQLVTVTEWLPNCYGTTLTVSKNSGAIVFRFVGSAWTIVSGAVHFSRALFGGTVAQDISQRLSTEVIDCTYSADEGSFYATYNQGEVTERLSFRKTKIRGYEDADDVDEVLDRLIEAGERVINDSYYEYFNASQNINDLLVLYDYNMMQNMLIEKEAYFPLILWPSCVAGDTLNLVIRGLKEDDFERIDFITIEDPQ